MPTNLELRVRCSPLSKALFLIPCGTLKSPWELRKPTTNKNNNNNKTLPRWHPRSVKSESYDHWKSLFYSFKQSHCPGLTAFSKLELFIVWMSRADLQKASLPYWSSGFLTGMLLHSTTSLTFCDQIWFTIIFNNYFFLCWSNLFHAHKEVPDLVWQILQTLCQSSITKLPFCVICQSWWAR